MEYIDSQSDFEGIETTLKKINCYAFIPKHIKYLAIGLESAVNNMQTTNILNIKNDFPMISPELIITQNQI